MFRTALVAMDLSPATEAMVSSLPGLREFGTEKLTLVHVAKEVEYPVSRSLSEVEEYRSRLRKLAGRLEGTDNGGFEVDVEVPSGAPGASVIRVARERDPDFILVGSRSHSFIREAFVGSVAWEVVRRAKRPVLLHRIEPSRVDPESWLETRSSGIPDRVIYPTDFSETAERAVPYLEELARLGAPAFTLFHSAPKGGEGDEAREKARQRLAEIADGLTKAAAGGGHKEPRVRVEVRAGVPSEEVLSFGGRSPENLVVMGSHGRSALAEMVAGSESRQVVRQAAARVLLVPLASKPDGG